MMKLFIALVAMAVMLMPSIASANLLSNPGFENPTASPWTEFISGGNTGSFTYGDATYVHGGSKSLKFNYGNYGDWGMGAYEQIISVTPSTTYSINAWLKSVSLTNAESFLAIQYQDTGGIWGSWTEGAHVSGTQDWTELTITSLSASNAANMKVALKNWATAGVSSGQAYWDDTAVIPEPTSLLLLGSGLVGLLGFGRKRLTK